MTRENPRLRSKAQALAALRKTDPTRWSQRQCEIFEKYFRERAVLWGWYADFAKEYDHRIHGGKDVLQADEPAARFMALLLQDELIEPLRIAALLTVENDSPMPALPFYKPNIVDTFERCVFAALDFAALHKATAD